MHSGQGVIAETTHAVLAGTTSRNLLYAEMTRVRETNHGYLHDRWAGEGDHEHREDSGTHTLRRGNSHEAAQLVRGILAHRDDQAHTAHAIAEHADRVRLPDRVKDFIDRRDHAVQARRAIYWSRQQPHPKHDRHYALERIHDRQRDAARTTDSSSNTADRSPAGSPVATRAVSTATFPGGQ